MISHRANNERFVVVGKPPVHDTNVLLKWRKLFGSRVGETNNERVFANFHRSPKTTLCLTNSNPPDFPLPLSLTLMAIASLRQHLVLTSTERNLNFTVL